MTSGATCQKQTASRDYECDGFFHSMVCNTELCVWLPPNVELSDDEERAKDARSGTVTPSRSSSFARAAGWALVRQRAGRSAPRGLGVVTDPVAVNLAMSLWFAWNAKPTRFSGVKLAAEDRRPCSYPRR